MNKQDLLHLVESLPDDADEDDLLYALYMRRSVELGSDDWKEGRVLSQTDVKQSLNRWLAFRAHVEDGLRDGEAGRTVPHEEIEREFTEWRRSTGL